MIAGPMTCDRAEHHHYQGQGDVRIIRRTGVVILPMMMMMKMLMTQYFTAPWLHTGRAFSHSLSFSISLSLSLFLSFFLSVSMSNTVSILHVSVTDKWDVKVIVGLFVLSKWSSVGCCRIFAWCGMDVTYWVTYQVTPVWRIVDLCSKDKVINVLQLR